VLAKRFSPVGRNENKVLFSLPLLYGSANTPLAFFGSLLLQSGYYFLECPISSMTIQLHPEHTVPYPTSLEPDVPSTLRENMQIAANTAALLRGLEGIEDEPNNDPRIQDHADKVFKDFAELAEQQFEEAIEDKPKKKGRPPKPSTNPKELESRSVAERIGAMLQEYNSQIVADAAELRQVTINKLLDLTMCGDPRIEIKATELLGKVSDVGLFTEKTEITVTYNSVSDIDNAIKDKIRKMMRLHAQEVTTIDLDVEKELGLTPAIEYTDIVPKDLFEEPEEPEDA